MKEPVVFRGGNNVWVLPDREWLVDQYILQGKARKKIASEIGADGSTVGKWLDELGIPQRKPGKVKPATSIVIDGITMRPPASIKNGKLIYWSEPDKAWLEYQYITLGKSAGDIAKEIGTYHGKVLDWLFYADISLRDAKERGSRHSDLMKGSGNPAYNGGTSRGGQNRFCVEAGKPCICAWCGVEGDYIPGRHESSTPKCSLDLHHKNHKPKDGKAKNLIFLCHDCNILEMGMWQIRKKGKANVSVSNKIITIDFNI